MDMTTAQRFTAACHGYEQIVRRLYAGAIAHHKYAYHGVVNAPNTMSQMRVAWAMAPLRKYYPVYSGGCESTVFQQPDTNLMFRFLHDHDHMTANLGTTTEDELELARRWVRVVRHQGASADAALIAKLDTAGQALYYAQHQQHVGDQRAFVASRFIQEISK